LGRTSQRRQIAGEGFAIFAGECGGTIAQRLGGASGGGEVTFAQRLRQFTRGAILRRVGGDGGLGEVLPSSVEGGLRLGGTGLDGLGDFIESLGDARGGFGGGDGVAAELALEGFELGLLGGSGGWGVGRGGRHLGECIADGLLGGKKCVGILLGLLKRDGLTF
jgi:hypothetical protein